MSTGKPLRADARRNRDALIAKAREIFTAGGFDMRYDDFAALAGVGVGTLYRHFPTREALAEAVYREEVAALCAQARELRDTLPAAEALAVFLRGFVGQLETYQGLARTVATLLAARAGVMAEGGQELSEAIGELLAAGVAEGTIRSDVGVGAVLMALHGVNATYGGPDGREDAEGVITLLLDGLRAA